MNRIIFIQDTIKYIKYANFEKKDLYTVTTEYSIDEFDSNIKEFIKEDYGLGVLSPLRIHELIPNMPISDIEKYLKKKEIILYRDIYYPIPENSLDEYEQIHIGKYNTVEEYNSIRNQYSSGSRYRYFYQFKKLFRWDIFGIYEIGDKLPTNILVLNKPVKYNIGDIITFYSDYMHNIIRTGTIIKIYNKPVEKFYTICCADESIYNDIIDEDIIV